MVCSSSTQYLKRRVNELCGEEARNKRAKQSQSMVEVDIPLAERKQRTERVQG